MSNALQFTAETMPAGWAALLPCPFCNAPARLLINLRRPPSDAPTDASVECSRCGSAGPLVERDNMTQEQIARFVARKWNRMHTNAGWKLQRIAQILGSDYIGPADSPQEASDDVPG